ncbi:MAG: hypothetical protein ACHQIG_01085 [Acidimicrobiia bacterium]
MGESERRPAWLAVSDGTSFVFQSSDALAGVDPSLLDRLQRECYQILDAAYSDAESIRSAASEEYHRIIARAQRERALLLTRAADCEAALLAELDGEIASRLAETERQRKSILADARAAGEKLRKVAIKEGRAQVRIEEELAQLAEVIDSVTPGPAAELEPRRRHIERGEQRSIGERPTPETGSEPAGEAADDGHLHWAADVVPAAAVDSESDLNSALFGPEPPTGAPASVMHVTPSAASAGHENGAPRTARRLLLRFRRTA